MRGYVKGVSAAGAFVALARSLEARVKLNNLADGYVEEPKTAFPEGRVVMGRIIATDHGRCSFGTLLVLPSQQIPHNGRQRELVLCMPFGTMPMQQRPCVAGPVTVAPCNPTHDPSELQAHLQFCKTTWLAYSKSISIGS